MSLNSYSDLIILSPLPRGSSGSGQRMSLLTGLLPVGWQGSDLKLGPLTPKFMLFSSLPSCSQWSYGISGCDTKFQSLQCSKSGPSQPPVPQGIWKQNTPQEQKGPLDPKMAIKGGGSLNCTPWALALTPAVGYSSSMSHYRLSLWSWHSCVVSGQTNNILILKDTIM